MNYQQDDWSSLLPLAEFTYITTPQMRLLAYPHSSPIRATTSLGISDQVYIKAKYFWTTQPLKKLSKKNIGSYEIITTLGLHLFTLCLPNQFCSMVVGKLVHCMTHLQILFLSIKVSIPGITILACYLGL